MATGVGASEPLRPDSSGPRHDGRREPDGDLRQSNGHMDSGQADPFGLHDDSGARDWLAMVVRKAAKIVKESSVAEKVIAILLAALLAMVINLNREVGIESALRAEHEANHPNVPIENELRKINTTLEHIDDRLDDLETFQVYGPPPP